MGKGEAVREGERVTGSKGVLILETSKYGLRFFCLLREISEGF